MHNYIYELLQAPAPADEWAKAWEYHEHPDAFPIAVTVEDANVSSQVKRAKFRHKVYQCRGEVSPGSIPAEKVS